MKPAQGIMKTADYGDAKSFRVACECTDPGHDVNAWIEIDSDREIREITLGFYVETQTPFWSKGFNRFKAAWDLLVKGSHRSEHHLVLNRSSAENFAQAITDSIKEIEQWQHPKKKQNS